MYKETLKFHIHDHCEDGLEIDSVVYNNEGEIMMEQNHGFSCGHTFNNEELLLLALSIKYPDLAKSFGHREGYQQGLQYMESKHATKESKWIIR